MTWRKFCLLMTAVAILGSPAILLRYVPSALACRPKSEPGTFLAYCQSTEFADYEHGAYFYQLEPEAIRHLKAADVVFLGNSRTQFGFSTPQIESFFQARGLNHYVLGFGYGEQSDFPLELIKKLALKPKILVINADPFFAKTYRFSLLQREDGKTRLRYLSKKIANLAQFQLCRFINCSGETGAIYRDGSNGHWIWQETFIPPLGNYQVRRPERLLFEDPVANFLPTAQDFIQQTGLRPDCIVLTTVPNPWQDFDAFVRAFGKSLNVEVIIPHYGDLQAVDFTHLDAPSAQKWSADFAAQLKPVLDRCIPHSS